MEYKDLLKKARSELPESVFNAERFEIPKIMGHIQGTKTVLTNFFAIADTLGRSPQHLLKFLLKELATPGKITKSALMLGAKVPASKINEKIRKYATEYVLCVDCGKPDTKIVKEGPVSYLKCMACGSKHTVKTMKEAKR